MESDDNFPGYKWFWNVHDILRENIEPGDIYHYIIAALGLKRFYDLHPEMDNAWRELRNKRTDVGDALNQAFRDIEENHLDKMGVFRGLDFNKNKFADSHSRDEKLHQYLDLMEFYRFDDPKFFESPEIFREFVIFVNETFYERYPRVFANFPPRSLIHLISHMVALKDGDIICDPISTNGLTILPSVSKARDGGAKVQVFAQAETPEDLLSLNLNLFLLGVEDAVTAEGNVIRNPGFIEENRVKKFNTVVTTLPFGRKKWDKEYAESDPYHRFTYGRPPGSFGEFAYLQHGISSLTPDGKLIAVVPPGILFRGGKEGDIRAKIITEDIIESVIALPARMLAGFSIPVAMIVINRNKPESRRNKIQFINAQSLGQVGRVRTLLKNSDVEDIIRAYTEYSEQDKFSVIKTIEEIAQQDYNLSMDRYFPQDDEWNPELNIQAKLEELSLVRKKREELAVEIQECLSTIFHGRGIVS